MKGYLYSLRIDQITENGDNYLKLIHICLIVRIGVSYYKLVLFNYDRTRSIFLGAKNGPLDGK
jgi:hypothetical protein